MFSHAALRASITATGLASRGQLARDRAPSRRYVDVRRLLIIEYRLKAQRAHDVEKWPDFPRASNAARTQYDYASLQQRAKSMRMRKMHASWPNIDGRLLL